MEHHIISLGAGTQSTDLLLRGLQGEFGEVPTHAIFSDTGNEPKGVYNYLEWLQKFVEKEYNFTIDMVSSGNIYKDALAYLEGRRKRYEGVPYYTRMDILLMLTSVLVMLTPSVDFGLKKISCDKIMVGAKIVSGLYLYH